MIPQRAQANYFLFAAERYEPMFILGQTFQVFLLPKTCGVKK
jgi:hypothetical protein